MKIKRIVALLLALSTLFSVFGIVGFAENAQQAEGSSYESVALADEELVFEADGALSSNNNGVIYSCVYDGSSQKISINGSVTHEIFVAHRDYTINLYKISPEESLKATPDASGVTLLASTSISIKFNFTAEVEAVADIFSQYVVVLVSKEGNMDYVGDRLYPFVESEYVASEDRTSYKGVRISESGEALGTEPSVAIVPVYLDKLISSGATGYLYSLEGRHIIFDKEYVDSIDRTVRSLYSSGSRIYFQLLLHGKENEKYDIPDIFSFSAVKDMYSYCDFLSERYSSYKNGFIDGIILGKNLDDTEKYNNNRYGTEEEYTYALALWGVVAGVATRKNIPSADVSYSFTSANTYGDSYNEELLFASSRMIERLSAYFDDFYSGGFDFSITLESSERPLAISNEELDSLIDISREYDGKYINERNADSFVAFLASLEEKYESSAKSFMYVWTPDAYLSGNALCCAYTYLYYELFSQQRLSAFVVGFDDNEAAARDIMNVAKYIDTDNGEKETSDLLGFFGKEYWAEIIPDFDASLFATRKHKSIDVLTNITKEIVGEFVYFEFSEFSNYNSWFAGRGFGSVSIDYHKKLGRSLCAEFNTDSLAQLEYAYLFNAYEYPESFAYTPYLTLSMAIEGNDNAADLFEIKVAFSNGGNIYEATRTVKTGEDAKLILDVSAFSSKYLVENIRISVRPLSEAEGDYKLFISSLKGSSLELDDEELKGKIEAERLRIRNSLAETDKNSNGQDIFLTIAIVVLAAVILSVMIFFFLGKDDGDENESENE